MRPGDIRREVEARKSSVSQRSDIIILKGKPEPDGVVARYPARMHLMMVMDYLHLCTWMYHDDAANNEEETVLWVSKSQPRFVDPWSSPSRRACASG
jgi:hypothetical protein